MDLINVNSLRTFSEYYENRIKLKVIHFCPMDGLESDPYCKRIVVMSDVSQTQQSNDRYLMVVFYGSYAKTPFKKSSLKIGQLLTLQRFETGIVPKNKYFKCNGIIIKDFYEPLILVKPEFKSIIKMIVSVREDITDNTFIPIQESESIDDSLSSQSNEETINDITRENENKEPKRETSVKSNKNPSKRKLNFDTSSDESNSSDQKIDNSSKRTLKSTPISQRTQLNKTIIKTHIISPKKNGINYESNSTTNSVNNMFETNKRHEYKTLIEVHNLMPVSGKTYVHIYGILQYRDFVKSSINLRDEKVYTFAIQLRSGNRNRYYPSFKTGDIIRIHRLLLAPNSMDMICTDAKDIVVFEAFQDLECFTPIKTSINPTFEDYDKRRKAELEEWFAEDLLSNPLKDKKTIGGYIDVAVQLIHVNSYQNRSILEVWDTTKPSIKTLKPSYATNAMPSDCAHEELLRIIHEKEMSTYLTVFDEHSNDVMNLKPLDFIVIFNLNVKIDQRMNGFHILTLHSGYKFGRCIRVVKHNSFLGKKMLSKIEEFKVISALNTSDDSLASNQSIDCFPSLSQPIDYEQTRDISEREITDNAAEEDMSFSECDQEFDVNFDEVIEILDREDSCLPSVIIVDIPDRTVLINELFENGVNNKLYKVKARVMNYLPSNDSKDIISVLCKNRKCRRIQTLRESISEDPLMEAIVYSSKENKMSLNCSKCKQSSCGLVFKLELILEDAKRNKVIAQLFGHNAQLFFKCIPEEVIQHQSKLYYVEKVLSFICAKISSLDSQSQNVILYWILQPIKDVENDIFIYQIRTATAIEMADKCVGFNSG